MSNRFDKYKRIVFVITHPYSSRDHERFGAKYLMDKGYDVEIWRVLSANSINMTWSAGMYSRSNYHEYSESDYEKEISKRCKNSIFIFLEKSDILLVAIKNRCIYIYMIGMGAIWGFPMINDEIGQKPLKIVFANSIRRTISAIKNPTYNIKQFYDKCRWLYLFKKDAPYVIVTSTQYAGDVYLSYEKKCSRVVYTHSLDYDRYIEAKSGQDSEKKYIVYIDTGFFVESYDSIRTNDHRAFDFTEEFFEQINRLFNALEEYYKLPVVIAGHPHLNYDKVDYGHRKVLFNQTCELVRDAAIAILTTSTAMSFVALYNTPTVKIVNKRLKKCIYGAMDAYSFIEKENEEVCGCGFLDLDDENAMKHPWDYVKPMDSLKRKFFIKKYIIDNDTTDRTVIQCVEDCIKTELVKVENEE